MPLPPLQACSFADLPGWRSDDHAAALAAFRRSALFARTGSYRSGSAGPAFEQLRPALAASLDPEETRSARQFFERYFSPFRVDGKGFVTGFYEPVAPASTVADNHHRYPVYARPEDLVAVDEAQPPAGIGPGFRFAPARGDRIVEYYDREAIERGALSGRGLEIAWLADRVELFFIHVQGAARLRFADGSEKRITYAGKSGHPFTGPGRVLAGLGEIPPAEVTMQSIRGWLSAHPERTDEILWRNRSFIFFREAAVDDPALGPVAAARVPLTAGRSMAIDRLLYTFATPFFIDAPALHAVDGHPFRRLMIAQDTGSAIVGAARGDLFIGSGHGAGEVAGVIRHDASFYCLMPRPEPAGEVGWP